MPRKLRFFIFLSLSIFCWIFAAYLTLGQMNQYDAVRAVYPAGTIIAGIPVGGLDANTAGMRLIQAYSQTPLEVRIDGMVAQLNPADLGMQLDLQGMLNQARQVQAGRSYWSGFWDYLMNRPLAPSSAGLFCSVSGERLHTYLQEKIAPIFEQPATRASPAPGDVIFQGGQAGSKVDLSAAEEKIRAALCEPAPRVVEVEGNLTPVPALPPTVDSLAPALEAITQVMSFDGIIEVYYQDLRSGKEINFAFNQGREISPGIAFTGASTIKIPVMISAYKRTNGPLPEELQRRMDLMIDLSDNSSTDEVMKQALDPNLGPIEVTQDMKALGLENTFLAGFFAPGAPLLDRFNTPANQRTDVNTDPDIYNQTTAADMGRLLAAIQRCASDSSGPLTQIFKEQITQAECQEMTGLLAKNRKGVLIEAGLPEGTQLAHKYGWVTDSNDGLLHTASDAAIVFTPGGNFVLTVYLYHPIQLPWDDSQRLVARLATAIYNFYNNWH